MNPEGTEVDVYPRMEKGVGFTTIYG